MTGDEHLAPSLPMRTAKRHGDALVAQQDIHNSGGCFPCTVTYHGPDLVKVSLPTLTGTVTRAEATVLLALLNQILLEGSA